MSEEIECCANCKFSECVKDEKKIGEDVYLCLLNPPTPIAVPTNAGIAIESFHPPVRKNCYCYQYQPQKISATVQ